MADKATTTGSSSTSGTASANVSSTSKKTDDASMESKIDRVDSLRNELREALIDAGRDPVTVDAQLYAIRTPEDAVVGNLADLQRMGALASKGESATMEDAIVTHPETVVPEGEK